MTGTDTGTAPAGGGFAEPPPARTGFAARALAWLRAGYPAGVPRGDYVVLLGLLRRSLTDQEVHDIARELAASHLDGHDVTTEDVERLVHEATLGTPTAEDVARVSSRLAAGGWPLADTREG